MGGLQLQAGTRRSTMTHAPASRRPPQDRPFGLFLACRSGALPVYQQDAAVRGAVDRALADVGRCDGRDGPLPDRRNGARRHQAVALRRMARRRGDARRRRRVARQLRRGAPEGRLGGRSRPGPVRPGPGGGLRGGRQADLRRLPRPAADQRRLRRHALPGHRGAARPSGDAQAPRPGDLRPELPRHRVRAGHQAGAAVPGHRQRARQQHPPPGDQGPGAGFRGRGLQPARPGARSDPPPVGARPAATLPRPSGTRSSTSSAAPRRWTTRRSCTTSCGPAPPRAWHRAVRCARCRAASATAPRGCCGRRCCGVNLALPQVVAHCMSLSPIPSPGATPAGRQSRFRGVPGNDGAAIPIARRPGVRRPASSGARPRCRPARTS